MREADAQSRSVLSARRDTRATPGPGVSVKKGETKSMDSGMISKIQKAKHYAQEPDRIRFGKFEVTIDGDNSSHTVTYDEGTWTCGCSFFQQRGVCSHTMAMERVLEPMLHPADEPIATEAE